MRARSSKRRTAVGRPEATAGTPGLAVELRGVRRQYGRGGNTVHALAGVDAALPRGTFTAIMGPSGSGKTTLTYLVPRLHEVTRGAVLVDGTDVRDVTLGSLADVVGMVTQEPYLFHGTITENLRYARADVTDAEIVEACRAANIHDRIMSFADGYETVTGSGASGCRAGRSSGCPSRACSSRTRGSSSSTRRRRPSTPPPSASCRGRWSGRWSTVRRSPSRTGSARS